MIDYGESFNPVTENNQRIGRIADGISSIMKEDNFIREPNGLVHISDRDVATVISRLEPDSVKTDKMRVGMVVGTGVLSSMLPNIPADVIVFTDQNAFIHDWLKFSDEAFLKSSTPKAYKQIVYGPNNPYYEALRNQKLIPEEGLEREIREVGDSHFLTNQLRFDQCKVARNGKQLLYFTVNLTKKDSLSRFSDILQLNNAEITFANMTNVWEHAGDDLEESLPVLPFHNDAVIIQSSRANSNLLKPHGPSILKMQGPARGLPMYINSAKSSYHLWNEFRRSMRPRFRRGFR